MARYKILPVMLVIKSAVLSLLVTLIGALGILFWGLIGSQAQTYAVPAAIGVVFVSLLAGGIQSGLLAVRKGWLCGALVGNIYALVMGWIISVIFPAFSAFDGTGFAIISMAIGGLGGALGINLSYNRMRGSKAARILSYRHYS